MMDKSQENTPEKDKVICPNGHYIKAFNTKAKTIVVINFYVYYPDNDREIPRTF